MFLLRLASTNCKLNEHKMTLKKYLAFLFIFCSSVASAQVTINITSVPANTPANASIYIAGSFNNWDPGNTNYILTNNGGTYSITLPAGAGTIQFKFTLGSWATNETTANGAQLPNRTFTYGNGSTINLSIARWASVTGGTGTSTAAANVSVLSSNFYIPQLNRTRKIWIYLPNDYSIATSKQYPVLYMQDGQNLFDNSTSFNGEWGVDEALNTLQNQGDYGVIVVGIENGGASRIDEYSPWVNSTYGGGQGDAYINFIANTLKPHIDSLYRTYPDRAHTALMGSSMGGLISFYGGEKLQNTFSRLGIFSPSLWFSNSVYTYPRVVGHQQNMRVYLMSGALESSTQVAETYALRDTLFQNNFDTSEVRIVIKNDGTHSEWFWKREFPACYKWLFSTTPTYVELIDAQEKSFEIYPNPTYSELILKLNGLRGITNFELLNMHGQSVMKGILTNDTNTINVSQLKCGMYIIKINNGAFTSSKKISKR